MLTTRDQDAGKGAVEQDDRTGNTSMNGQLGHRDQDPMLKGADSDFPEPGENPEHSGEHGKVRKSKKIKQRKA